MRYTSLTLCCLTLSLASVKSAHSHFLELVPSTDTVTQNQPLTFDIRFTHPMQQGPIMDMSAPVQVKVKTAEGTEDLQTKLTPHSAVSPRTWQLQYQPKQPGDHLFYVEPQPYWEPSEGKMIIHYTKVIVDAFAGDALWDQSVGLPVEIEPLTRPYGLWTGNQFRGIVKHKGVPVPFTEVEVEWRNDGSVTPPHDNYLTQVVKTDSQGIFSYTMPKAGWWGFAALVDADTPMKNPNNQSVPVELGGLLWVQTRDMK